MFTPQLPTASCWWLEAAGTIPADDNTARAPFAFELPVRENFYSGYRIGDGHQCVGNAEYGDTMVEESCLFDGDQGDAGVFELRYRVERAKPAL